MNSDDIEGVPDAAADTRPGEADEASRWRTLPREPVPAAAPEVGPGWEVVVTWVVDGEDAVPSEVTLVAPPGEPVTAVALRRLKVATHISKTRGRARIRLLGRGHLAERFGPPLGFDAREAARVLAAGPAKRGRKRTFDDDHYRRVAAAYLAAEAEGRPPVAAVSAEFEHLPTDTRAKGWVQRARALGFLPPARTTKGGRNDG